MRKILSIPILSILLLPYLSHAALLYSQPNATQTDTGTLTTSFATTPARSGSYIAVAASHLGGGLVQFAAGCPVGGSNNFNAYIYDETANTQIAQAVVAGVGGNVPCTATVQTYTGTLVDVNSGGTMVIGHSYKLLITGQPTNQTGGLWFSDGTDMFGAYTDDGGGSFPTAPTNTRITSITPLDGSTIATSSTATIGATGYINADDFQTGMFVQMQYALYSNFQASVANPSALFTTINFPLSSAGPFSVSTTSSILRGGQYTLMTQIRTPSLLNSVINFFGFSQFATFGIQTATSTKFYAVAPNGYDIFVASTTNSINAYIASSTISLASCSSWTSFSLGDCLNLLFVPQVAPIKDALDSFKNGFLSYAPWGYITRFAIIMSGSATTTLPSISVNIPLGDPHNATYTNGTFTLNTMDMLQGGDDLLNTVHTSFGADLSFQDATEPFVKLSIGLALMMYIVHDLLTMRGGHSRKVVGKLH